MDSTDIKDKIVLDPTESPAISELFSRKQPGDEISFTGIGTLDEAGAKVITLSIQEFNITGEEDTESPAEETEEGSEGEAEENMPEESAAVSMYKKGGVAAQEGNISPDTYPR